MSIYYDMGRAKKDLGDLPQKMLEWASEVLHQQADLMVGLAKVYVNVDTGSLRDSIRRESGGEGLHWRRVRVRAGGYVTNPKTGKLVNYAAVVEVKYPYMRPAWEEVKPTIAEMIKAKIVEKANR